MLEKDSKADGDVNNNASVLFVISANKTSRNNSKHYEPPKIIIVRYKVRKNVYVRLL